MTHYIKDAQSRETILKAAREKCQLTKQIHQNNIILLSRNLKRHKSITWFKALKTDSHQPKFTMAIKVIFSHQ